MGIDQHTLQHNGEVTFCYHQGHLSFCLPCNLLDCLLKDLQVDYLSSEHHLLLLTTKHNMESFYKIDLIRVCQLLRIDRLFINCFILPDEVICFVELEIQALHEVSVPILRY